MDETNSFALSQIQALGVSVALRLLERILFSLEELYTGQMEAKEGILVSLDNPLSPLERQDLSELVRQARAIIGTLASRFGLQHETADLTREVHGRLVEMWATLVDTHSLKLRRYGFVDPTLSTTLDPEIEQLTDLVVTMDRLLFPRGPRRPRESQSHGREKNVKPENNRYDEYGEYDDKL